MPSTDLFDGGRLTVIDGGLSTQLERRGHDVSGTLWTARLLLESPGEVQGAHEDMIRAGAEVITTASYQISRAGFIEAGFSASDADQALRASIEVARAAAFATDRTVLVAASVGPYGAITHDGREYQGRYGISMQELTEFHAQRLRVLIDAGADLLAIETIPDVDELHAIIAALQALPAIPAWISVTACSGSELWAGQSIEDAAAVVDAAATNADAPLPILAFGVNCTDPRFVEELLTRARSVTDLPLLAYANAGGLWADDEWQGADVAGQAFSDELVRRWIAAGVQVIGGCCGSDARDIARIRSLADAFHDESPIA
jgi:homocysteine S-methyltransferase